MLKSDVEPEMVEFYLQLEEWTEYGMLVFINFTNPLIISKGLRPDQVIVKVLEKSLFFSYDGSVQLMSDRVFI